jgi:hypothetical protein
MQDNSTIVIKKIFLDQVVSKLVDVWFLSFHDHQGKYTSW